MTLVKFDGLGGMEVKEMGEKKVEHSPLPWKRATAMCIAPNNNEGHIEGPNGELVCRCATCEVHRVDGRIIVDEQTRDANAAFICHCVNNHAALVEALKEIKGQCESDTLSRDTKSAVWSTARAALEKAGEL